MIVRYTTPNDCVSNGSKMSFLRVMNQIFTLTYNTGALISP